MTESCEQAVFPTTVLHTDSKLFVEVVDEVQLKEAEEETRQDEALQTPDQYIMPISPQEMGQEALWVEDTPRRSVWKIASPSNDSAKKTQKHKAKILLLNESSSNGGDIRVNATSIPLLSTTNADEDKRKQAERKAQAATSMLTRAIASTKPEQRLQLAESAFELANQARFLLGMDTQTSDQKQAREHVIMSLESVEVSDANVWKGFRVLLPSSVFALNEGLDLATVNTEHQDDQDISTLGFNNTFELPSAKNIAGSKSNCFDLMSMSSLNEILDGPLDDSPRQRKDGVVQVKKKRLRIAHLFRSRKAEASFNKTGAVDDKRHTPPVSEVIHEKKIQRFKFQVVDGCEDEEDVVDTRELDMTQAVPCNDGKLAGHMVVVKVEHQRRPRKPLHGGKEGSFIKETKLTTKHVKPQEDASVQKSRHLSPSTDPIFVAASKQPPIALKQQLNSEGLPEDAVASAKSEIGSAAESYEAGHEADMDVNVDLQLMMSQSPLSTGGTLDDKYKISIFEAEDVDRYRIKADNEECFEIWSPCKDRTSTTRRTNNRCAQVASFGRDEDDIADDSDNEKEKYFVEEDKYLVENMAGDVAALKIPNLSSGDAKSNSGSLTKRSLRWFQRRNNIKTPIDLSTCEGTCTNALHYPRMTASESAPLKRSNSKRSTKSSYNHAAISASHSSQSNHKESLSAKKRRKPLTNSKSPTGMPKSILKRSGSKPSAENTTLPPQYFDNIHSMHVSPWMQPDTGSDALRPVRISVIDPVERGARAVEDMNEVQQILPVANEPLLKSIMAQQTRMARRGLDPVTGYDAGDDRGIDP